MRGPDTGVGREDLLVQVPQLRRGLQTEFQAQQVPYVLVGVQGLAAAAALCRAVMSWLWNHSLSGWTVTRERSSPIISR